MYYVCTIHMTFFNCRSSKNHSQPQASPSQQQRAESYGNETGAQPISVQDAINKFEHTTISHPAGSILSFSV